jgi:hypothetical protein
VIWDEELAVAEKVVTWLVGSFNNVVALAVEQWNRS